MKKIFSDPKLRIDKMKRIVKVTDLKEAGLRLKVRRLRSGRTQYDVAAQLGIHPGRLCEIEKGRRRPSPDLLKPKRGGFMRPFGCGSFVRDYLTGKGPHGSQTINPNRGAPIVQIKAAYNEAILRAHAEDWAARALEKGSKISADEALRSVRRRFTRVRSHSFYRYFALLKQLGWVTATGEQEPSLPGGIPGAIVQPTGHGTTLVEIPQPQRFYRFTQKGRDASDTDWSDPLKALYGYNREARSAKGHIK